MSQTTFYPLRRLLLCCCVLFIAAALDAKAHFNRETATACFIDDFADGQANNWSPLTPSRWKVSYDAGSLRYFLNTSDYDSPDGIRMGELSLLKNRAWGDFTFSCLAKSADAPRGNSNADLCVAFGYQDFDSYYYINFNTIAALTQLHRIHNGARVTLATYSQRTFIDGQYHALRIERSSNQIRAYFDGSQILSANDSFFGAGQIGVGSYNDSGYFDAVSITEPNCAPSELFTDIGASLTDVAQSAVAWGDYDNDGNLDILLTGEAGSGPATKVYRSNGGSGSFSDIGAALPNVRNGTVAWGDYDNDGDLDILLTGDAAPNSQTVKPTSAVFKNDRGKFVDAYAVLVGVHFSAAAWGDYDNDGDLDILLAGFSTAGEITKIYRNDGGKFTDLQAALDGVSHADVAWGDYDNDGDLDFLLTGSGGAYEISKIFRNDRGKFSDIRAPLPGVRDGAVAWGDYDADGDLDFVLSGRAGNRVFTTIYRNDVSAFLEIAELLGVDYSAAAWGDYDNDGDLDLLLAGFENNKGNTILYRNDGDGSFNDVTSNLAGIFDGAVAWGDYDADGDLDLLLTGNSIVSKIYRNNSGKANNTPNFPGNLRATVAGNSLTLSWDKANDDETPTPGLTYNLRLGTSPAGIEIISPMGDRFDGQRRVPSLGNANHNTNLTIKNLAQGTYYWSVQAIDNTFAGSYPTPEQTVAIGPPLPPPPAFVPCLADDFEDGNANGWSPQTPSRWQVSSDAGSLRYFLNTSIYNSPDGVRLGELSLLDNFSWGDFIFACAAKSVDAANNTNVADLAVVFGYQDADSYYYINFNANPGLTRLYRIHNGANTILATYAPATFADGNYHTLRVERSGSSIKAYFDSHQLFYVNDSFFGKGLVGVGSFNDSSYFDDIKLAGDACAPPPPVAQLKPVAPATPIIGAPFDVELQMSNVQNLFGLGFELNYTNTALVEVATPTSGSIVPGSFLGNDVVFVSNVDEAAGKVSLGISRKAGQGGVSGSGDICKVKFISLLTTPPGTSVVFSLSNVVATDPAGNPISLGVASATATLSSSGVIVWPGDANNDKVVNQGDVLPLGLHWNRTGPARQNASNSWAAQTAAAWTPANATYADGNGDGVVNQGDVLPVGLNWGKTHASTTLSTGASPSLAIGGNGPPLLSKTAAVNLSTAISGNTNPGQDFYIEVRVDQVSDLFGLAFELLYAPNVSIDPLGTEAGALLGSDVIFLPMIDKSAGKISLGLSRKAGQGGVSGAGIVARIKMHASNQAQVGQTVSLNLQNATAIDPAGQALPVSVSNQTLVLDVASQHNEPVPATFMLHANMPNPFNPSTTIHYDLAEAVEVNIEIFDMLGKHVRTLVKTRQSAGRYAVAWDGRDDFGKTLASGVFIYQLRAVSSASSGQSFMQSRKMLLIQ